MNCCTNCFAILFALIIWTELVCGLAATGSAAFFNPKVKFGAYLVFVIDVLFASGLFYYSGKETFAYLNDASTNKSVTMNWICGMCTVATVAIFGAVYFSTPIGSPALEVFYGAGKVYIFAVFMLWLVATTYMVYLRLGCAQPSRQRSPTKSNGAASYLPMKREPEMSLEQSLTHIVENVENNPVQKTYTMYAVGSETPFQVTM